MFSTHGSGRWSWTCRFAGWCGPRSPGCPDPAAWPSADPSSAGHGLPWSSRYPSYREEERRGTKTLQHLMRGECFNIKMKDSFHFNRQLKVQECVSWHWQQLCGSWTDRAAYHSAKSSGQLRVLLTMRAPWDGGLDQVVLTIFSIWDRMRVRFSLSWATTVRLPTLSSDNSGREKRDCFIKSHLQLLNHPGKHTRLPRVYSL